MLGTVKTMINFNDFTDAKPWYEPFHDLGDWFPWILSVGILAAFGAALYMAKSDTRRHDPDEEGPPEGTFDRFLGHLAGPPTTLLTAGLPAAVLTAIIALTATSIPLPSDYKEAAGKVFYEVEQAVTNKYAVEGIEPVGGKTVETVESLEMGGTIAVEATLPDNSEARYFLEVSRTGTPELTNPEGLTEQKDPANLLAEDVLQKKDSIEDGIRSAYMIAGISPVTSADTNDAAAWLDTFGMDIPKSAFQVRVQFYDGHQTVLYVVSEGDSFTLVGTGDVSPVDYVR